MWNKVNMNEWLLEQDAAPGQPDPPMMQSPMTDPNAATMEDPNAMQDPAQMQDPNIEPPDVTEDPQAPDMPEMGKEDLDFEVWKNEYFKMSIKGNNQEMEQMIRQVMTRELDSTQKKFTEDNLQILQLQNDANIKQASREIRTLIRDQLDQNNPATSVVSHIASTLEKYVILNNVYIKLSGMHGIKGDPHRKYIAALTGSVQVGSGANTEDIVYNAKDFSIAISTRMNSKFGDISIGRWCLKEDDATRYLAKPELEKLENGSPEEKDVLRKRVVIESIASKFDTRAFVINIVNTDGTIYHIGWDLSNTIKSGYQNGKLVVKFTQSDNSEAMITDDGDIVSLMDMEIMYVRETGSVGEDGKPQTEEIQFMERKEGQLFLSCDANIMKEVASSLQGMFVKEYPWQGNPSDIGELSRCFPSVFEMLMRQC